MLIKYGVDFLFPKKHPRSMVHKAGEVPFGWAIRLNCTCIYIYIFFFFFFFFLLPQSIDEVPGRSRSSRTDDILNYNRLNWLTDVACKKKQQGKEKDLAEISWIA